MLIFADAFALAATAFVLISRQGGTEEIAVARSKRAALDTDCSGRPDLHGYRL